MSGSSTAEAQADWSICLSQIGVHLVGRRSEEFVPDLADLQGHVLGRIVAVAHLLDALLRGVARPVVAGDEVRIGEHVLGRARDVVNQGE